MGSMQFAELAGIAISIVLLIVLLFRRNSPSADVQTAPMMERLQTIKADVDRLDRVIREDGENARTGADERGRLLREEVLKSLTDSRAEQSQVIASFRAEIVTALEKASQELRDSSSDLSKLQKERLDDVAGKLKEMTDSLDARLEANRTTIELKLNELRDASSAASIQLRDEIQLTLTRVGSDLSTLQKERLDDVAGKLREMTDSLEARLEANRTTIETKLGEFRDGSSASSIQLRDEIQLTLSRMGDAFRVAATEAAEAQRNILEGMGQKIAALSETNAQSAEKLRLSLQEHLNTLRTENSDKLELMRQTVDEKLQGTLEKRLGESFKIVSERLEQVHKGLGEMQTLATGVGDLKRVLTNVKVRGTWGETQLSNLLAQVFSPEQYFVNVATRIGSNERVEFAIRLPGRGPEDEEVLLPIDAKFPREDYERLVAAAEIGDAEAVEVAAKALDIRIKGAAKDICDKYLCPPRTTDFAILFLPTEGLYAEVLRRPGLSEFIQKEFKVSISGPTTLHALLNSLQMGFKTLAIQRRSSEVWEVLGAVKTEFSKYGSVLEKVKKKLDEASNTVSDVAVRHRAVTRSLRVVSELPDLRAQELLGPGVTSGDEDAEETA